MCKHKRRASRLTKNPAFAQFSNSSKWSVSLAIIFDLKNSNKKVCPNLNLR